MKRYTIYCTEEQAKKALGLGAPISTTLDDLINRTWFKVTAEQMIGWLEAQKNILEICIKKKSTWRYEIYIEPHTLLENSCYFTRKEASLAAIDKALDYLMERYE